MENLHDFLNEYLMVIEPTEEEIKEAEKEAKKDGWDWRVRHLKEKCGIDKFKYYTHCGVNKMIRKNLYSDCVVAYTKDRFMGMAIIKSKVKFFALTFKNSDIHLGGQQYSLMDANLKDAYMKIERLLVEYPEGTKIDKPELWQKMKNTILINELDKS